MYEKNYIKILKLYIQISKEIVFVRVKVHQSTVGLGTYVGSNHDKKCGHGQRASSPTLLGRAGPV